MKKLVALLIALVLSMFSAFSAGADVAHNPVDTTAETKFVEWALSYSKRCKNYRGKIQPRNWAPIKKFARRVVLAPLCLFIGTACAEGSVMDGITVLNEGNPISLGQAEGHLFTVSPSTAKKHRGYYTDKKVPLTKYEKEMYGVVVGQNRGMLFSSKRKISGDYAIPELSQMNIIVVDEKDRTLYPVEDNENKISWKGDGERSVKDVIADGQGQHWFCHKDGRLAVELWLKIANLMYGVKGMLQPGLATDIGCKVIDHWGVERTITKGNTLLLNSSLVKGLGAYNSLEELIEHGEMWGLTELQKQWQSGDHIVEKKRIMGTQPNATNLALTKEEVEELLRPDARKIWAMKYPRIAWMKLANINTTRGRAIAARPALIYNNLIKHQIDSKAGNDFLRIAQGKFMAEGQYLKMYMDKLVYSYVYVHGMNPNEAAKKAAETGLHGEIRVNPSFAGIRFKTDEDGNRTVSYDKETWIDNKGRYIETALVRYPHGAPSETIVVKAYLDSTVPEDVIIFPAPVANEDGTIPVKFLYALRLQGADFDGDAVTAFTERLWIKAQKRNIGKAYMVIPINTVKTEKDKEKVTDETFETFFEMKVESLSNRVGLIATSLKYYFSQFADRLRNETNPERDAAVITDHACAMGDDIDEYKHGKANNDLDVFVVKEEDEEERLYGPYFNRYAKKYKTEEEFNNAVKTKKGTDKKPGKGVLDMYASATEMLMGKSGLPVTKEVAKASDNKDRFFYTVHPATWETKDVDLFVSEHGEGQKSVALPAALEELYGIEHGTLLSAKDLFLLLYRDHSANCKDLLNVCDNEEEDDEDRDLLIKAINKINERYALAKVAIVAWTKAMKLVKTGEEINAEEAMKVFSTLLVQHTNHANSPIGTMTWFGKREGMNGESYEKTIFSAERLFNYFLDVCGDGLLLTKEEEADFPEVSETFTLVAEVKEPDMEQAKERALKELSFIDKLIELVPYGLDEVRANIEAEDDVMDGGTISLYAESDLDVECMECM